MLVILIVNCLKFGIMHERLVTLRKLTVSHSVSVTLCQCPLPINVPTKNTPSGTPMIGEVMLMNQLGRNGVIRRNMM